MPPNDHSPARSQSFRRLRPGRILALVIVLVVGVTGWLAGPSVRTLVQLWRARQTVDQGRLAEAEARLRSLIREDPTATRPRLLWVQVARRLGRINEAEQALQRAVELGLPIEEGRREFALIFAGRDFARAEGSLLRVLDKHPDDREVLRALAEGYARAKRWKRAVLGYSEWLKHDPGQGDALLGRARASWEAGKWRDAEADFQTLLEQNPNNFEVRIQRVDCLLNDAKMAEAEPELRACQQLRPDRPEPLVGLAACAIEEGEFDRAEMMLDQALSMAPNFVPALIDQAKLLVARQLDHRARPLLERATQLVPNDEAVHRGLAQLYRRIGEVDRAAEQDRLVPSLEQDRGIQPPSP